MKTAIALFNVPFPVVMDNDFTNWRACMNRYWPTKYLIDKKGVIRLKVIGEGSYKKTDNMIQRLLAE